MNIIRRYHSLIVFLFCLLFLCFFQKTSFAEIYGNTTTHYDYSQAAQQLIQIEFQDIVIPDGAWLLNRNHELVQVRENSDSYDDFLFLVLQCNDESCRSFRSTSGFVYSVTTTEGTYESKGHNWLGSVFTMPCRPSSVKEVRLIVEEPGNYKIFAFFDGTENNYFSKDRYYESIVTTIKDSPAQIQNGTCGMNVSYTIEGNIINFSKEDPDSDAIWDYDCSIVLNGVPIVKVNDTIRVTNGNRMFYDLQGVWEMHLSKLDVSNVTDMSNMFASSNGGSSITYLDLDGWDVSNVTNMSCMFYLCRSLIYLDLNSWNVSNVTDMSLMFRICDSLKRLYVSDWNVSNVINMNSLFDHCNQLEYLDVSKWDVSNVTRMGGLFSCCNSLTYLDVSKWDTSNVTDMSDMFYLCRSLEYLDVGGWNVSKVTGIINDGSIPSTGSMSNMFNWCSSLKSLDLSKWDVSNVRNTNGMFYHCDSLVDLKLSNWDVSQVEDMSGMFWYCGALNYLDLRNWDISKVTEMRSMFKSCRSLSSLDLSGWDVSNVDDITEMFTGCNSLSTLTLGKNTLNKNIFESLPLYHAKWIYVVQGETAIDPIRLGSVRKNAALFTDYDFNTMAGTWSIINYICLQSAGQLVLPSDLKEISESAFEGLPAIYDVFLPDGVQTIGRRAFADCFCLSYIRIPDSVTEIGEDAFINDDNVILSCQSDNTGAAYARQYGLPYYIEP